MPGQRLKRPKLTEQLIQSVCRLVAGGMTPSGAFLSLSFTPQFCSECIARGEGRKTPSGPLYRRFVAELRAAQAGFVQTQLTRIDAAAAGGALKLRRTKTVVKPDGTRVETVEEVAVPGDWKAAAWLLEKTAPSEYGKGAQPGGNTTPQVVVVLPDNGRGPGRSEIPGGVRRRVAIEGQSPQGAIIHVPQAPIHNTGGSEDLSPKDMERPTIHHKRDQDGKHYPDGTVCPDCRHPWRFHRKGLEGEITCCKGGCPCTRAGE
jgi:hypothetical protein